MKIEDWRSEIDEIDNELLRLLNRRARLATEVGFLKRAAGIPINDPARETEVLERVRRTNVGPLGERAVTRLFRCIIRESKAIETSAVQEVEEQTEGILR